MSTSGELLATAYDWIKNVLFAIVFSIVLNILITKGPHCLIGKTIAFLLHVPGFRLTSAWYMKKELRSFLQQIGLDETSGSTKSQVKPLPEKGKSSVYMIM